MAPSDCFGRAAEGNVDIPAGGLISLVAPAISPPTLHPLYAPYCEVLASAEPATRLLLALGSSTFLPEPPEPPGLSSLLNPSPPPPNSHS
eukprot:CAMPEP_0202386666 /NCGR_PEP_ID=MMETSP1127-20130417/67838_1 /ASSEMBLY_ACC=CAM_ASM_000462 /TAXON_ID=3047 /ORGANISM="Dunaliella tertiolecta, Strain CCMP1320" /LENGTH=89 /DNA_ID=CAMNT_0048987345 /DNA_START=355 /DNA_END=624 /DNA_ORIENTATION=+